VSQLTSDYSVESRQTTSHSATYTGIENLTTAVSLCDFTEGIPPTDKLAKPSGVSIVLHRKIFCTLGTCSFLLLSRRGFIKWRGSRSNEEFEIVQSWGPEPDALLCKRPGRCIDQEWSLCVLTSQIKSLVARYSAESCRIAIYPPIATTVDDVVCSQILISFFL